jgi:hypothetical protein
VFEKIKYQEEKHFVDNEDGQIDFVKGPGFGTSKTDLENVAEFYNFWDSFTTYKNFAFADKWKV